MHNTASEYEQSVIAGCLLDPGALPRVAELLAPDDFESPALGLVFKVMTGLHQAGAPVDLTTVTTQLLKFGKLDAAGGPAFLANLADAVGSAVNIEFYARQVQEAATIRRVEQAARLIQTKASRARDAGELAAWVEGEISKALGGFKKASGNGHQRLVTALELQGMEFKEPAWVIPGLLPIGYTLFSGPVKLGKSWLTLCLAVAVASGGCALGKAELRAILGGVLYLGLEDKLRRLQRRLAVLLPGSTFPQNLTIAESWPRLDKGGLEDIDKFLTANPTTRFAVIDTLGRVAPPKNKNSELYEFDTQWGGAIHELAHKHSAAVLVVHHNRKGKSDDIIDLMSGSTGKSGAADTLWVLRRGRGRADGTLFVTGRDVQEAELALKFHPQEGAWELLGEAAETVSQEREDILLILREAGPKTPAQLAKILDKSKDAVRMSLTRMESAGLVRRNEKKEFIVIK